MAKLIVLALVAAAFWFLMRKGRTERLKEAREAMPAEEREARAILKVPPAADADAIRAAHRRRIAEVHPDRGGSDEETRAINAARDFLLGRTRV